MSAYKPEAEVLLNVGSHEREAHEDEVPAGADNNQGSATRQQGRRVILVGSGIAAAAVLALVAHVAIPGPWRSSQVLRSGAFVQLNKANSTCTEGKGNCHATGCCTGPGMQCFEQDAGYAQCRVGCIPGPDPTHWDGKAWTCKELGTRTAGEDACAPVYGDCTKSHCCRDVGFQCFQKNANYAACKTECIAGGPDLSDGDSGAWSCKKLGDMTPGWQPWVQGQCSTNLDNCVSTKCCKREGEQCSLQNDYYGNCMGACVGRGNGDPWSCKSLGSRTPSAPVKGGRLAPWVLEKCSLPNAGCQQSKCCIGMDVQCYEKNHNWAQCRRSCTAGADPYDKNETWSCKELGPRSMGLAIKGYPSLYCFVTMRTTGYEVALMESQWAKNAGIFECDEFAVFTPDGSVKLGNITTIQFPGAPVVTSQDGTAGNTKLFVHVWDAVVKATTWQNHSWVVKVDPDAVLIAERLRWHLAPHTGKHVFIVNCNKFPGPNYPMVYGALEVLSNSAMAVWAANGHDCYAPDTYGEDFYLTRCMDKLGVGRILDETILGDNLCMGAGNCDNGYIATFHPFKDAGTWEACYNAAHAKR